MTDSIANKLAVMDALARYSVAIDSDDREAYVASFDAEGALGYEGPDGVSTMRVTGSRAIGRVFDAQLAHKRGRTRHLTGLPLFESIDAGPVRTRTPFVVTVAVERDVRPVASGIYRDTWVVGDGGARLLERIVALDAPLG